MSQFKGLQDEFEYIIFLKFVVFVFGSIVLLCIASKPAQAQKQENIITILIVADSENSPDLVNYISSNLADLLRKKADLEVFQGDLATHKNKSVDIAVNITVERVSVTPKDVEEEAEYQPGVVIVVAPTLIEGLSEGRPKQILKQLGVYQANSEHDEIDTQLKQIAADVDVKVIDLLRSSDKPK